MAVVFGGIVGFIGGFIASRRHMEFRPTEEEKVNEVLLSQYPDDQIPEDVLSPERLAKEIRSWPSKQARNDDL